MVEIEVSQMSTEDALQFIADVFRTCSHWSKSCEGLTAVDDHLLDDEDAYVKNLLDTRLSRRIQSQSQSSGSQDGYMEAVASEGLSLSDIQPPDAVVASAWNDLLVERERLVLGHSFKTCGADLYAVDTSQSLGRAPTSVQEGLVPTLTPGCQTWIALAGFECLRLPGWPASIITTALASHSYPDHLLKDLAGNSFDCHVVLPLLLAVLVHFPEKVAAQENSQEDEAIHNLIDAVL